MIEGFKKRFSFFVVDCIIKYSSAYLTYRLIGKLWQNFEAGFGHYFSN